MSDRDPVIIGSVRTAIGTFGGALKDVPAVELGGLVIAEACRRAGVEFGAVDEVIMGNILQAGLGQNPARQAALRAGLPESVPAETINKVCGSGLKAVIHAAQAIETGDADVVVAGGMESMSQAPYVLPGARWGQRMGDGTLVDVMIKDGLWCAMNDYHMGVTAENLARKYEIGREEQDRFALESQRRAAAAQERGDFDAEIVTVEIPRRKGDPVTFNRDEHVRADASAEGLAKLRPAFDREGSVTAGNASGINDGAAALVVASAARARELGVEPLARLASRGMAGVDPKLMGIGPVPAVRKALERLGRSVDDVDGWELNEAFAVQSLAVLRELEIVPQKVNVRGGAIALGHPIGASGARILVTLLSVMKEKGHQTGVAGLCIGGGQGVAVVVER